MNPVKHRLAIRLFVVSFVLTIFSIIIGYIWSLTHLNFLLVFFWSIALPAIQLTITSAMLCDGRNKKNIHA
jgi:hypothetical protein